jgi:phage baseplate assembly protein W
MDAYTLLGQGPTYPLQRVGGDFQQATGLDLIEASIFQILRTKKGELPWFQEFGTNLDLLRHRPIDEGIMAEAQDDVSSALQQFESRIEVRNIAVNKLDSPKQGFLITVTWAPVAKPGSSNTVLTNDRDTEVTI